MRIIKCNITNFGCYSNKVFDFNSSLNSFCINNGEGKTTLAIFIKAMLYSLEKSSTKSYERKHYKPYSGGLYGGSMVIELDNKIYKIERTFGDTPSKDTLKIYDENGVSKISFLNKSLSLLQGEASSELGNLILGIDAYSFLKCNFISSNDLDFASSESIKMKIGNVVIDKEKENSFEETLRSIMDVDLRVKEPTRKNENAYPYRIKELQKINLDKRNEIKELNKLELNLKYLYDERNAIKDQLNDLEIKQKKYESLNIKKGQLTTIKSIDEDIAKENNIVYSINDKYHNDLLNDEEVKSLDSYLNEYEEYKVINNTFKITPADIDKLKSLDNKIISSEDYQSLYEYNTKLNNNNSNTGIIPINENRYQELENKFEGKNIKDDIILNNLYIDYKAKENQLNSSSDTKQYIDYPSNNIINHIESEIEKYNSLQKQKESLISSYKEPSIIVKLLLIIFTLGIYFIVLNNKKKKYQNDVNTLESSISKLEEELNSFFTKYQVEFGSYEVRMNELKQKIEKYNSSENNENEELLKSFNEKKNELLSYFALFDYASLDINNAYDLYKKELTEYNSLKKDYLRNKEIENNINNERISLINKIQSILNKYNLSMNDDFTSQLSLLKQDMDFYTKYNPIYINKCSNDSKLLENENKLKNILNSHNINIDIDISLTSRNVINDIETYKKSKSNIITLTDKKNNFIKDNDLNGFVEQDVDTSLEELNKEKLQKSITLSSKEDEISQNEEKLSKREELEDEIEYNNDLIKEYQKKVEIAKLAAEALKKANEDMEGKYISPIKNSFINYANKIYDKIGSNVSMNYDYEINYDVNGQIHSSKDLSEGERTILMLAIRFAILDSLYKDHNAFIVLDDPFEALDPDKLSKAKDVIKELSKDWQIIYFTCHDSRKIEID